MPEIAHDSPTSVAGRQPEPHANGGLLVPFVGTYGADG